MHFMQRRHACKSYSSFHQFLDCSHQCEGLKDALRNARTARSLYHGTLCFTLEKKNSHIAIVLTSGMENPTASEVVTVQTSSSITESGLQLIHSLTWITWWCLPKPPFTGENRLSACIHAQIQTLLFSYQMILRIQISRSKLQSLSA